MTKREYQCKLMRVQKPFLAGPFLEAVGEPLSIRIDLASTPSQVGALLYAMRQVRAREENVERYKLQLIDDSGNVFRTIYATSDELELHNAGYPVSASGRTDGGAGGNGPLAGVSDEELIAELRRRLVARPPD